MLVMHILNGGREIFLGFLRNITSQAVILAAGTVIVAKNKLVPFSCCDLNNLKPSFFASLCFIYGILSIIASTSLFFEQYINSLISIPAINKIHSCTSSNNCSSIQRAKCILPYVLIHKPFIFIEFIFILTTPLLSFTVVIYSTISSSASYLKTFGILH